MQDNQDRNKIGSVRELKDYMIYNYYETKFLDNDLEESFHVYLIKSTKYYRMIMNSFSLLLSFLIIGLFHNSSTANNYRWVHIYSGVVALLIFITIYFFAKKPKHIKILTFLFSICFLFVNVYNNILSQLFLENQMINSLRVRDLYMLIIFSILDILTFYEYNFFHVLINFLSNFTIICLDSYLREDHIINKIQDILISLFIILLTIIIKNFNSFLIRENFFQKYLLDKSLNLSCNIIMKMNIFQNAFVFFYNNKNIKKTVF